MRYVTLVARPADGSAAFHPVGERLEADPSVTREAIHRFDSMDDGTIVMVASVSGDLDRYDEILAESPEVLEHAVSGDDSGYAYSRIEANERTEFLVSRERDLELVLDMPIEITEDGGQRLTLIGSEDAFARADYDPPGGVNVEIERMGEYYPESDRLLDALTDRQREILRAAVEAGYYDHPRRATQEDVADRVDCSPGTVGEHLQKIERAVFGSLVG